MAFRSPPKPDNDSDKGRYAPVHVHAAPPPQKGGRVVGLLFVAALLVLGVLLMTAHHLFDKHLDGKSIDPSTHELPPVLQNQANVNFIGTAIAHGVRIAFSMAIGVTFGQLFWNVLRSRTHTIAQIDALVNCGQSPFSISAISAMTASFTLFVISLIAAATALIVVLSPGALTVQPNFQRTSSCTVPSIPQSIMTTDHVFNVQDSLMDSAIVDILSSNSYIPPFQGNLSTVCGAGCSYNLTFIGPAALCVDVTNQTNFTGTAIAEPPTDNITTIWEGDDASSGIGINITMYDMVKGEFLATNCAAYNATYHIGLKGNPPTIRIWNVTLDTVLQFVDPPPFMNSYATVTLESLTGSVLAEPNGFLMNGPQEANTPQVSQFFEITPTGNHTFSTSASQFVTTLLENATLSLLSGNLAYNLSGAVDAASNLQHIDTTCTTLVTVYQYDSTRLLVTDGVALAITVIVVAFGCWLLVRNGREQKVAFSDILHIALNEQLFAVSQAGGLNNKTPVYLETSGDPPGRLLPVTPIADAQAYGNPENSNSSLTGSKEFNPYQDPTPSAPTRSKRITGVHFKMVSLILATVLCMGLQHAYYHYLNGKAPSAKLDSSGFLRDQTAVSDIGIALSYLAQVFLAVAISSACVQLLWRNIRARGHPISQIDALMKVNANPLSLPLFSALGASLSVPLVALLAASTTVVSIFAPGAIKVNPNHSQTGACTVLAPRNFSNIAVPSSTENVYVNQNAAVISLGTYLPPIVGCETGSGSQCSYDLQFVGPGLTCENVTATANFTAFAGGRSIGGTDGTINLFQATIANQTSDLSMVVTVETWDVKRSEFQAVNCTGVARSYAAKLSLGASSLGRIDVSRDDIVDTIRANISTVPPTFEEYYMYNILLSLNELVFELEFGTNPRANMQVPGAPIDTIAAAPFGSDTGGIGAYQLDGNITWQTNMSSALEALAQNFTLSLFSDTIFNYNPDDPNVLESTSTTCRFEGTAYEYTPFRLFVTYGAALAVAVLCAVWGSIAIAMNGGVAETVEFSRVLKGLLNGRMFSAREGLDERTRVRAEDGAEGALVPTM